MEFHGFRLQGLVGKGQVEKVKSVYYFVLATLRCRRAMKEFDPDCVVGTGGYAAAPACFAASMMGIPLVLHEMNYRPGLVTRLLAGRARVVAVGFEQTAAMLPKSANTVVTGVPVRMSVEALADASTRERMRDRGLSEFGFQEGRKTLLVFGGSQGAEALNRAVWRILPEMLARGDIQLLHLVGARDYGCEELRKVEEASSAESLIYRAIPYTERMDLAYSVADLVVCRAGAGTLAELMAVGVPCVLVPFPHATGGHQEMNAMRLSESGQALLVKQEGDLADDAFREGLRLLDDPARLRKMRESREISAERVSSKGIAEIVEEVSLGR